MSIGSLTQEDPIGLAGGLNLYGFANGDPVNFTDPLGLCADGGGDDAADQGDRGDQLGDSTKAKPKPKPKPLSCHYQISTGHFTCQEPGGQWNVVDAFGFSGLSGGYKNNWAMESVKDHGPIPVGTYEMTPMPGNYHGLGVNTIVLTPTPGPNALFDRTWLRIHGGRRTTGCIILDPNARSTIAAHGGGSLTVTP